MKMSLSLSLLPSGSLSLFLGSLVSMLRLISLLTLCLARLTTLPVHFQPRALACSLSLSPYLLG